LNLIKSASSAFMGTIQLDKNHALVHRRMGIKGQ